MTAMTNTTTASQLWFTAPFQVEVRAVTLNAPGPGEVLVRSLYSAVSAGTELLLYRGQLPESMSL
ncbi:MAG: dehydrogenase, partial [Natronospirillum sp.]